MFYTDIIYLLLAIILFSSWPSGEIYLRPSEILLAWLAKDLLFVFSAAFVLRRARTSAQFLRAQSGLKILAFGFFALDIFFLDLPSLFKDLFPHLSMLRDFLGLLVFIQYLILLWTVSAFYEKRGPLVKISVPAYVMAHLRLLFPFLVPWFLVNLSLEGLLSFLGQDLWTRYGTQIEFLYFIAFIVALVIMVPPISIWVWQCTPLPKSNLRRLIRRYLEQEKTWVREILLWGAFGGRLLTAGVIGLFRPFRYLLLTPALLAALEEPEVLSVVAHEVGHLKRRHMFWLLVFFIGFALLVYTAFPLIYLSFLAYFPKLGFLISASETYGPEIITSISLIIFVLIYFRLLFGLYLRHFERQADLYCLESLGTAAGLIRALKKVAALSGHTERLPSWHHYSIAERIDFLEAASKNPALIKRHHRRVKILLISYLLAVALLTLFLHKAPRERLEQLANYNLLRGQLLLETAYEPDSETYRLLGDISMERGREAEAIRYYEEALKLDPENATVLNNLAWLLVTAKDKRLHDPWRALSLARKATEKEPLAIYLDTLAEAWFAVGNANRACIYASLAYSRAKEAPDYYPRVSYYREQRERFCRAAR